VRGDSISLLHVTNIRWYIWPIK